MNSIIQAIGDPILALLVWLYEVVPNLGFGIIVLTIVINTLLFPLVLKQARATKAFQKIGPEIKKLQEKYKDDQPTLQQEMVKLQRENGASPGGCLLPMLVQLPIWWALFRVLRDLGEVEEPLFVAPTNSALGIALSEHSASFLGMDMTLTPSELWSLEGLGLTILPYLLLILAMVGLQFFQQQVLQRYNNAGQPDSPQAQQMQTITKIMPVMFGVFAWNFVAGLTVYWAASSVVRLGQQIVIQKMDEESENAVDTPKKASKQEVPTPDQEAPEPQAPPKKPQGSAKKRKRRRRR
ncbi:MAG: YidC/Oxa1 family membrane protein insertase [Acidimicrobiia bacterium]|nr:MAG: YidC/Oxa1 family membrane protein insertase [Acidimicrobiia bacterium]